MGVKGLIRFFSDISLLYQYSHAPSNYNLLISPKELESCSLSLHGAKTKHLAEEHNCIMDGNFIKKKYLINVLDVLVCNIIS